MNEGRRAKLRPLFGVIASVCILGAGCHCVPQQSVEHADLPRELAKTSLPDYIIEPPDVLLIDAIRVVPLPSQTVQPLDKLLVQFPADPTALTEKDLDNLSRTGRIVSDIFPVEPDGTVNLGARYGKVRVAGMLFAKVKEAVQVRIEQVTAKTLVDTGKIAVELAESRGTQQIRGDHLVRQDGKVSLGIYGSVRVAGLTLEQAKATIQEYLSRFLLDPEVSVDVAGYNSKVYYIVTDGAGYGEQVARFPITGQETVLDALSQINGLPPVAAKNRVWIARPCPPEMGHDQILPVNWNAIVRGGSTATNYQVFPGDRIYVEAQPLLTLDIALTKIITPMERIFGVSLLGNSTVHSLAGSNNGSGTGTGGGF
jgi:polysaccharide export outer membrane protein